MAVAVADEATRRAAEAIDDPRLIVVDNPTGSTPAGLNLALLATTAEIVVRCDAHSVLPDGYVRRAIATLEATGAVNVGGRQVPRAPEPMGRAIGLAMTSRIGAGDARYRVGGRPGPVDTVYLGVFRRKPVEAIGGFDEGLDRNQDYELNWRLLQTGAEVWFDPELEVEYRPRSSLGALWRQYFEYGRWKRVVLTRHPGSLRWRQAGPPLLVAGLGLSLALAPLSQRAAAVLPTVYLAVTTAGAVRDGLRSRDIASVLEPAALWTMHVAWGTGFILGPPPGRR